MLTKRTTLWLCFQVLASWESAIILYSVMWQIAHTWYNHMLIVLINAIMHIHVFATGCYKRVTE